MGNFENINSSSVEGNNELTVDQKVDGLKNVIINLNSKLKEKPNIEDLKGRVKKLDSKISNLQNEYSLLTRKHSLNVLNHKSNNKLDDKMDDISSQINIFRSNIITLEGKINEVQKIKDGIESKKQQINVLRNNEQKKIEEENSRLEEELEAERQRQEQRIEEQKEAAEKQRQLEIKKQKEAREKVLKAKQEILKKQAERKNKNRLKSDINLLKNQRDNLKDNPVEYTKIVIELLKKVEEAKNAGIKVPKSYSKENQYKRIEGVMKKNSDIKILDVIYDLQGVDKKLLKGVINSTFDNLFKKNPSKVLNLYLRYKYLITDKGLRARIENEYNRREKLRNSYDYSSSKSEDKNGSGSKILDYFNEQIRGYK